MSSNISRSSGNSSIVSKKGNQVESFCDFDLPNESLLSTNTSLMFDLIKRYENYKLLHLFHLFKPKHSDTNTTSTSKYQPESNSRKSM
jgi:hypothetical protein